MGWYTHSMPGRGRFNLAMLMAWMGLCVFNTALAQTTTGKKGPAIRFDAHLMDKGYIPADCTWFIFPFTNVGDQDLIVQRVSNGSAADWERGPIAPGVRGEIKVLLNLKNRIGAFSVNIDVLTNAYHQTYNLTLQGNVIPRKSCIRYTYADGDLEIEGGEYNRLIIPRQAEGFLVLKLETACKNHNIPIDLAGNQLPSGTHRPLRLCSRNPFAETDPQRADYELRNCSDHFSLSASHPAYLIFSFDEWSNENVFVGSPAEFVLPIGVSPFHFD